MKSLTPVIITAVNSAVCKVYLHTVQVLSSLL